MKKLLLVLCCALFLCSYATAQKTDTFEGITYSIPKGWEKKATPSTVELSIEGAKGACQITLFKPLPGSDDSKANFTRAWNTLVKETIKGVGQLDSQPASQDNGWTMESGFAPYDMEGKKGIVLLATLSGNKKMVNILILTNTDAYQSDMETFLGSVHLPKIEGKTTPTAPTPPSPSTTPRNSKFQFTSTNFDDGWTATEQADWVKVTKGNLAVLVHYPNQKADAYNSVLKDGLQNAWNILVAPRYSNIRNFALKPIQSFESIAFAEADAQEKATGRTVHIVLFKKHFSKGNGKYLEFVSPSKSAFEQEFGPYRNEEFGWDKLVNMQTRNKFDVSSKDLSGKWATGDSSTLSYYYANSGRYAGATAVSTADAFTFSPSGTYESDHSGASGNVGNQKFARQVYKGKHSANKWKLTLTNRFQGASETYDCYFEAVKGGRILVLTDKRNTVYSLVKQ